MGLPNLKDGQDPSEFIVAYQDGILARTTKLADISGRLESAFKDTTRPASVTSFLC